MDMIMLDLLRFVPTTHLGQHLGGFEAVSRASLGQTGNHVVTDTGTELWGWTRTTPKNNHDFRLLLPPMRFVARSSMGNWKKSSQQGAFAEKIDQCFCSVLHRPKNGFREDSGGAYKATAIGSRLARTRVVSRS
jgi:hypothetical protein